MAKVSSAGVGAVDDGFAQDRLGEFFKEMRSHVQEAAAGLIEDALDELKKADARDAPKLLTLIQQACVSMSDVLAECNAGQIFLKPSQRRGLLGVSGDNLDDETYGASIVQQLQGFLGAMQKQHEKRPADVEVAHLTEAVASARQAELAPERIEKLEAALDAAIARLAPDTAPEEPDGPVALITDNQPEGSES